jgi:hypothetical protein
VTVPPASGAFKTGRPDALMTTLVLAVQNAPERVYLY